MKRNLMISIAICSSWAVLLSAAGIYAGTTVDDIVKMQNPAYDEHTKAIVQFKHKAHAEKFDGQQASRYFQRRMRKMPSRR